MTIEDCHVAVTLVGRPGVEDEFVGVFRTKRELREWLKANESRQHDPWPWESVSVVWLKWRLMARVEYMGTEAWNAGIRWPGLMRWLEP